MYPYQQITRLALGVFRDEGKLSVAGHGLLKKVFLSAYLSENGQRILPPREHFYFNKDARVTPDLLLVRRVSTYFLLSEDQAIDLVRTWESNLLEKAAIGGVKFGEFGNFIFNDQLDFEAETLLYYQFLPEVAFKSVGASLHEYPATRVQPTPVHVPEPNRRKILVPALWGVLIVFFGFAIYLWSGPLDQWMDQKSEMETRLVNVAPKSYTHDSPHDFYNDTDDLDHGGVGKDSSPSESVEEHIFIGDNENTFPAENTFTNRIGDTSISPVTGSMSDDSGTQSRCTLIVGAFAEPGNVERMIERLSSYGMEVVTMERRTLTLVGAEVTCSDTQQMNTLREEIDPKAWIYNK